MTVFDDSKLRQYLLGALPDEEAEEVDLLIIVDEGLEEQLIKVEDDLIEEYLDEAMNSADFDLFRTNFLICADRIARVKHLHLLRHHARATKSNEFSKGAATRPATSIFEKIPQLFHGNLIPATATVSVVVLVLFLLFGLPFLRDGNGSDKSASIEREVAELNRKDLTDLSQYQNCSIERLTQGVYRDQNNEKSLVFEGLTDRVVFLLPLPGQVDADQLFSVRLLREDAELIMLGKIPAYNVAGGRELRIILPGKILRKGDYRIKVEGEKITGLNFSYPFLVR